MYIYIYDVYNIYIYDKYNIYIYIWYIIYNIYICDIYIYVVYIYMIYIYMKYIYMKYIYMIYIYIWYICKYSAGSGTRWRVIHFINFISQRLQTFWHQPRTGVKICVRYGAVNSEPGRQWAKCHVCQLNLPWAPPPGTLVLQSPCVHVVAAVNGLFWG